MKAHTTCVVSLGIFSGKTGNNRPTHFTYAFSQSVCTSILSSRSLRNATPNTQTLSRLGCYSLTSRRRSTQRRDDDDEMFAPQPRMCVGVVDWAHGAAAEKNINDMKTLYRTVASRMRNRVRPRSDDGRTRAHASPHALCHVRATCVLACVRTLSMAALLRAHHLTDRHQSRRHSVCRLFLFARA